MKNARTAATTRRPHEIEIIKVLTICFTGSCSQGRTAPGVSVLTDLPFESGLSQFHPERSSCFQPN